MTLSDRIALMRSGRIEQIGTPSSLYRKPRTRFAADFMAARNILDVVPRGACEGRNRFEWCGTNIVATNCSAQATAVAVRPESIILERSRASIDPGGEITAGRPDDANACRGTVVSRVDQGAFVTFVLCIDGAPRALVVRTAYANPAAALAVGDAAIASWRDDDVIVLEDLPADAPRAATQHDTTPPDMKRQEKTGSTA